MRNLAVKAWPTPLEAHWALKFTAGLLLSFALLKPWAPSFAPAGIALALMAFLQFYVPFWRIEKIAVRPAVLGWHTQSWRKDVQQVAKACLLLLLPYLLIWHIYHTYGHSWLLQAGYPCAASWVEVRHFQPQVFFQHSTLLVTLGWLAERSSEHLLGAALPEETFYRGYLQLCLQKLWPKSSYAFLGLGRPEVISSAVFALAHFSGEWQLARLATFFPGLAFAWLRKTNNSLLPAVGFHLICNLTSELLYRLYLPL